MLFLNQTKHQLYILTEDTICRWLEWIQIVEDANLSKQNCFMDIIGINLVLKHLSGRQTVICIGIVKIESNQRLEDLVLSIIEGVWA